MSAFNDLVKRGVHRWKGMHEWLRAFFMAVVVLVVLHLLVARVVIVHSTSMFATLWQGDLVLVHRWPKWTGFDRQDIVVFRDPLKDDRAFGKRPLLVKRIVGMPGDVVQLNAGVLWVNGKRVADPTTVTHSYLLRLREGVDADSLLEALGIPPTSVIPGRRDLELPLNAAMAERLEASPKVISVAPMSMASGARRHIFPYSPRFQWNGDTYGPITVPRKGDTLRISLDNLPLYDRLISRYEGHRLSVDGDRFMVDNTPLETYVVEQDHYFVLGDARHHSADSRYWGFVPGDHLVGRASLVLLSKGSNGTRNGRALLQP